jgi:glutamyl-tRNA reductase
MTDRLLSLSRLVIVGANHRSSSLITREKLVANGETTPHVLEGLKDAGIGKAVVIATGDRLEVLTLHDSPTAVVKIVARTFAEMAGLELSDLTGQLFVFEGEEAARHVFAVMATLDGFVPGDPHIRGQLRNGHELSVTAAMNAPDLDDLIAAADKTGELVLLKSDIANHPSSLASAAVHLAKDVYGDLSRCSCVMLGAGDMGELLAGHFHKFGLTEFVLMGEEATRIKQLARKLGGRITPMDDLTEVLAHADILVSSLGTRGRLITTELAAEALKQRKRRQMLFFDAAIPGDMERAVGDLEGAFLFDLNDLENLVMESRMECNTALHAAWEIVEAGLANYMLVEDGVQEPHVVAVLRQRLETLRKEVLGQPVVSDAGRATELFMEKILKDLSEQLRTENSGKSWKSLKTLRQMETTLRRLFGLTGRKGG